MIFNDDKLIFNILDWNEEDEDMTKYVINIFGKTIDKKSVYIKILNFNPRFFILLPEDWTRSNCDDLIRYLKSPNGNKVLDLNYKSYDLIERKKFYGFNGEKNLKFIVFMFNSKIKMHKVVKYIEFNKILMYNKSYKLDIYESNIDPYLRFMHMKNIISCGWLELDYKHLKKLDDDISTCYYNYEISWHHVKPLNISSIAPFYICSFDIECTSADGRFPQATNINDKIIQIGLTFTEYGCNKILKKIMISLNTCDSIDDVEVIECENEIELLLKFQEIIIREDPDILTGYNILAFDEPYIYNRAEILKVPSSFYYLSRLKKNKCKLVTKNISSSALGDNKGYVIETCGRIHMDLMKLIQRDHKISSYKLDSVAEYFTKNIITDIKYSDNELILYTNSVDNLKINNYIKLEINGEVFSKKHKVINLDIDSKSFSIIKDNLNLKYNDKIFWSLVKDDIHPQDIFAYFKKDSYHRKIIAQYCIQDCVLVSNLLDKLEIITNNFSMASVCYVPLNYILFRGQGIKSLSLVAKYCRDENYLIPLIKYLDNNIEDTNYQGATVFEPIIGFYKKPVVVLDYNSLYPSSIISDNISQETYVDNDEYDNLENYDYKSISVDDKIYKFAFNKITEKRGIIPQILINLLNERKLTKKLLNDEKDKFKKNILDGKQLALKITANSIYGQLGALTSPIYFKKGAACTTAIGRYLLNFAKNFIENEFIDLLLDNEEALKDETIQYIFQTYSIKPYVIYGDSVMPYTYVSIFIGKLLILTVEELGEFLKKLNNNWIKYNNNKECINIEYLKIHTFTNNGWKIMKKLIRHKCQKKIYRVISNQGYIDVTEDHSLLDNNKKEIKPEHLEKDSILLKGFPKNSNIFNNIKILDIIENKIDLSYIDIIVNANNYIKRRFLLKLKEFYYHYDINEISYFIFETRDNNIQKIYYIIKSLNYHIIIKELNNKIYIVYSDNLFFKKNYNDNKIQKVKLLENNYDGYVYDIETEDGNFLAGIGETIIKNTDSIFINMNFKIDGKDVFDKSTLLLNIKLGQYASSLLKSKLPYPHNMEYEKTFYPFALMAKKKYIGNKYEDNDIDYEQKSMGIVLKRRDNAPIVKFIIGNIVKIMLNDIDVKNIIDYIKITIENLLNGKYGDENFITSKTLKATYKGKKIKSKIIPLAELADIDKSYSLINNNIDDILSMVNYGSYKDLYLYDEKKKQLNKGISLETKDKEDIIKFIKEEIEKDIKNLFLTEEEKNTVIIDLEKNLLNKYYYFSKDILLKEFKEIIYNNYTTYRNIHLINEFKLNCSVNYLFKWLLKNKKLYVDLKNASGTWSWDDCICSQSHVYLSQKIKERDPGNVPQLNDRIPFITIENNKKILQSHKIENPDYIKQNNLKIDYLFYLTNQIKNPAIQFLELIMDQSLISELFNDISNKKKINYYDNFIDFNNKPS